ncbi:MAG: DUF368 domain-containing protein [Treponema sp.]
MIIIIRHILIGVFIGLANIIPGVSGGTAAVICNVYDKLLMLSSLDIKRIKAEWKLLLSLIIGVGGGIAGFAKLVTLLYRFYPAQTNFFFLGIILGSIPFLYENMNNAIPNTAQARSVRFYRDRAVPLVLCVTGAALMLVLFFIQRGGINTVEAVTTVSHGLRIKLFFMGILSAFAMLIPGISGSFVLLILGAYQTIIQAVAEFNLAILMPFGAGVCVGLVAGARIIAFFFNRFPAAMYGAILGLIAGSAIYLFPTVCQPFRMRLFSGAALLAGYSLVSFFSRRYMAEK